MVVAREVIKQAQREGLDREKSIRDLSDAELDSWIQARMYNPTSPHGDLESGGDSNAIKERARL